MTVIDVQKASPAAASGMKVGDVLMSMDGIAVKDLETYQTVMSTKRWADPVVFVVTRDQAPVTVTVLLRRKPPTGKEAAAKAS